MPLCPSQPTVALRQVTTESSTPATRLFCVSQTPEGDTDISQVGPEKKCELEMIEGEGSSRIVFPTNNCNTSDCSCQRGKVEEIQYFQGLDLLGEACLYRHTRGPTADYLSYHTARDDPAFPSLRFPTPPDIDIMIHPRPLASPPSPRSHSPSPSPSVRSSTTRLRAIEGHLGSPAGAAAPSPPSHSPSPQHPSPSNDDDDPTPSTHHNKTANMSSNVKAVVLGAAGGIGQPRE